MYEARSDDELMLCVAREANAGAFGVLVRRHQGRVLGYATRMLGNAEAAADIAQETFLRLWTGRARYSAQNRLASYLLSIAHHLCVSDARTRKRHGTLPLDGCGEARAVAVISPLRLAVRDAVLALPEEKRAVFVLSEYVGLSYAEIAETLAIPAGTVASRKNHAIRDLRIALADWQEKPTT